MTGLKYTTQWRLSRCGKILVEVSYRHSVQMDRRLASPDPVHPPPFISIPGPIHRRRPSRERDERKTSPTEINECAPLTLGPGTSAPCQNRRLLIVSLFVRLTELVCLFRAQALHPRVFFLGQMLLHQSRILPPDSLALRFSRVNDGREILI
jgi:hypothetical protein